MSVAVLCLFMQIHVNSVSWGSKDDVIALSACPPVVLHSLCTLIQISKGCRRRRQSSFIFFFKFWESWLLDWGGENKISVSTQGTELITVPLIFLGDSISLAGWDTCRWSPCHPLPNQEIGAVGGSLGEVLSRWGKSLEVLRGWWLMAFT